MLLANYEKTVEELKSVKSKCADFQNKTEEVIAENEVRITRML